MPTFRSLMVRQPALAVVRGPLSHAGRPLQRVAVAGTRDAGELEADRIADAAMRAPAPGASPCPCGGGCPRCAPGAAPAGRPAAALPAGDAAPPIVDAVLRSAGRPLDDAVRGSMEPRFGHDFGSVRVHADAQAAASAQAVGARAYAVGEDLVFGAGEYRPRTSAGQRLLAHELAHVVQQRSMPGPRLQRQASDPWLGRVETAGQPLMLRSAPEVPSPSHLNAVGKLARGTVVTVLGGSRFGWMKVRGVTTDGDDKTGYVMGSFIGAGASIAPPGGGAAATTPPISVDRIDVVTGSAGAVTGFPQPVGNSDLNRPGPFNSPPAPVSADWPFSGECTNVHQIHFHLDNGSSSQVRPVRRVKATWSYGGAGGVAVKVPEDQPAPPGSSAAPTPGGFAGRRFEDDGPAAHEVLRFAPDAIAVADPPGVNSGLGSWSSPYPFRMRMHFDLTLWSRVGPPVARVKYSVFIDKQDEADVPNTRNEVVVRQKKDLVRDRELP